MNPNRQEFAATCYLIGEETAEERKERKARKQGKEYQKPLYSSSLLKVCYSDCLGVTVAKEIGAGQPCPSTIR